MVIQISNFVFYLLYCFFYVQVEKKWDRLYTFLTPFLIKFLFLYLIPDFLQIIYNIFLWIFRLILRKMFNILFCSISYQMSSPDVIMYICSCILFSKFRLRFRTNTFNPCSFHEIKLLSGVHQLQKYTHKNDKCKQLKYIYTII